jgi:hypothetical protein
MPTDILVKLLPEERKSELLRGGSSVLTVQVCDQAGDLIRTQAVTRQAVPLLNFISAYVNTVPDEHS